MSIRIQSLYSFIEMCSLFFGNKGMSFSSENQKNYWYLMQTQKTDIENWIDWRVQVKRDQSYGNFNIYNSIMYITYWEHKKHQLLKYYSRNHWHRGKLWFYWIWMKLHSMKKTATKKKIQWEKIWRNKSRDWYHKEYHQSQVL